MRYGNRGLVLRENVHALEIDRCEFTNGLPPHVYWTDVKNRDQEVGEAYPEFQSAAIAGSLSGSHIHDSVFRDVFDGITLEDGTTDTRITDNVFVNSGDDAINLSRGISNVEVAHNLLWQVMGGIANLGSRSSRVTSTFTTMLSTTLPTAGAGGPAITARITGRSGPSAVRFQITTRATKRPGGRCTTTRSLPGRITATGGRQPGRIM